MRLMFATIALEVMSTCKKAKLQSGAECGAAREVCRDMATEAAAELMQSCAQTSAWEAFNIMYA